MPPQRRLQREEPLFHERDHVVRIPRFFCDADSQESKHRPAEQGSDGGMKKTLDSHKEDSAENKNSYGYERNGKKKRRCGISRNRRM
jgi:hypothetical protein